MDALVNSLGKADKDLLRETEEARMAELTEDELAALHKRIRRARNKYTGVYRRKGSAKVGKKGGRGLAKQGNARNAARAEVFEDALARVSIRLGEVAAEAANQLRTDRLAAAKKPGSWPGAEKGDDKPTPKSKERDRKPRNLGKTKREASSRAAGARRQAKKDSR